MDGVALGLGAAAQDFLRREGRLLIGGRLVEAASGRRFPVIDPATGRVVAEAPEADSEDVARAVLAARTALEGAWGALSPADRSRMVWAVGDLIDQHADELAELEALDNGKPVTVARGGDVPGSAAMWRYMAGWATRLRGASVPLSAPGRHLAYTLRQPVGVVAQIIPWNYPLLMAAWKLAPALAAGCAVVLKPAEQTPLTALRLGELILEAGFPAGAVNILSGFGESAGAALAAHEAVDKVAFTGSTDVGRRIVRAAAGNLKRVTLELGGKSPVVVFPDADLSQAIPGAAQAIFSNHGQNCCAGSRLFVHQALAEAVAEGIAQIADSIRVGAGLDPATEMGPLVSAEQLDRVKGFIEDGVREGARVRAGGADLRGPGYFVRPTVLTDVRPDMRVVREEIFGPVLTVQTFRCESDLAAIAAAANDTPYGLAASVWTSDLARAHGLAGLIQAGTVWINCHNVFDPALPFGGFKQSGWGREMGEEVLAHYTETKSVVAAL